MADFEGQSVTTRCLVPNEIDDHGFAAPRQEAAPEGGGGLHGLDSRDGVDRGGPQGIFSAIERVVGREEVESVVSRCPR